MRSLSSHLVILATPPSCHELCNANLQLPYSYLLNRLHYEAQVDKQMTTSRCLKKQIKMHASSLSKEQEEQLLDALTRLDQQRCAWMDIAKTNYTSLQSRRQGQASHITITLPTEKSLNCVGIPRPILEAPERRSKYDLRKSSPSEQSFLCVCSTVCINVRPRLNISFPRTLGRSMLTSIGE